jgi:hypothetical protein
MGWAPGGRSEVVEMSEGGGKGRDGLAEDSGAYLLARRSLLPRGYLSLSMPFGLTRPSGCGAFRRRL